MWKRFESYIWRAFSTRWNLLFFSAGVAAGLLSGRPDIVLPLVGASEIFYLANMMSNERFRLSVDAQSAAVLREAGSADSHEAYMRIRNALPKELLNRFDRLRDRCMALVQLAGNMRGPEAEKSLEKSYSESLERLLWGYLRMTWSANTLSQFLAKTDSKAIHEQIGELEKRLESMPAKKPNDPVDRLAATTLDHLATSRDRLENIAHSRRKLDIIVAEIERMEAKIAAIAESAVGKLDVDDIASRVDEVAEGMRRADETMRELQLPAQFEPLDEPPQLLRQKA